MEQTIRVGFLTQDSGLGEVIARTLGNGFATRTTNELHFDRLDDLREWCDVVLLDLRAKGTQGDLQKGLRIMDQMSKTPSDSPVVVLCDADSQDIVLTLIQHGAYDSVTSPPNMIDSDSS